MEFRLFIANVTDFLQSHPLAGIAALAVLVFFSYKSAKELFKFLVFLAIMALIGYFILQLGDTTSTSVSGKKELTHKTRDALGE